MQSFLATAHHAICRLPGLTAEEDCLNQVAIAQGQIHQEALDNAS